MRHAALEQELSALRDRVAKLDELRPRMQELERQLSACTRDINEVQARTRPPSLLSQVRVASPCGEDWELMTGDERVRHCGRCDKDVYNLSGMPADAAEALLREAGEPLCVRFYRRADGTLLSGDCSVGARKRRRRKGVVAAILAGAAAVGAIAAVDAAVSMERAEEHELFQGGLVAPPELPQRHELDHDAELTRGADGRRDRE